MGQIAVDVVLLPDDAMMSRAIDINRQLIPDARSKIVLNKKDCLPHISLAMGGLDEAKRKAAEERLGALAHKTAVRELRIVDLQGGTNSRGETTCLLEVDKTPELQSLHEQVMQEMKPLLSYDVSEEMLDDEAVASSTLEWIRTFPQKAGYERFQPHITVGYGRFPGDLVLPIPFFVTQLALCHLGNHGTCRRILAAIDLSGGERS